MSQSDNMKRMNNNLTLYNKITNYSEAILDNRYIELGITLRGNNEIMKIDDNSITTMINSIPRQYLPLILSDDHMFSNLDTRANAEVIRWHYLHDYSIVDSNNIRQSNSVIFQEIIKLNFPLLEMLLISVIRSKNIENVCGNNSSLPLYLLAESLTIESILGPILLYDANLFYIFLERILEFNSKTKFTPDERLEKRKDSRYQLYQWVDYALTYRAHNENVILNDILVGYDKIVSSIECSSTNEEKTFPISSILTKYTPQFEYYNHYGLYMNNYMNNNNNSYYINLESQPINDRIEIKNTKSIPFFTMSLLVRTCVNYTMLKNIIKRLYKLDINDDKRGRLLAFKYPSTHILISKLSIDDRSQKIDENWKAIEKYSLAKPQVNIINNFVKNITQPEVTILGYDNTGYDKSDKQYSYALGYKNIINPLFKSSFPLEKDNWLTSDYSLSYRGPRTNFPNISQNIISISNNPVRPKSSISAPTNNISKKRPKTSISAPTNNNIPILFHRRFGKTSEKINTNNFNKLVNESMTAGVSQYQLGANNNLAKKFTKNEYMNYLVNEETDKNYNLLIDGSKKENSNATLNEYLIKNVGYTKGDFSTINIFVGSSGSGKSTTIGTALYISTQVKSNYGKISDDVTTSFKPRGNIPSTDVYNNDDMKIVTRSNRSGESNGYYGINAYRIIPNQRDFQSIIEPSTENETSSRNAILWNTVRVLTKSTIGSKCVSLIDTMGFENVNIYCYGKTRSIKPLDLIMYSTRKGITAKDIDSMLKMMPIPSHTIGSDGNKSWEVPNYPKRVNELIESFSAILDTCKTFHQYNNVIDTNMIHKMKTSNDKETLEKYNAYKKNPIINYLLDYTEAKYKFLIANKNSNDNSIMDAIPYIQASMKYVFSITLLFSDNALRKERDIQVFQLLKVFIENPFDNYINNLITPQHIKTHILSDRFE